MTRYKYTETQLRDAISSSLSIAQVLSKLGIIAAGGNYHTIKLRIRKLNIDTSHFKSQGWNKGLKFPDKTRPISEYLNNERAIGSDRLRRRLIREGLFQPCCAMCNLANWLGNPIPLELDHINGNRIDNVIENLRLLCPNCHALTPTYRGRNRSKA